MVRKMNWKNGRNRFKSPLSHEVFWETLGHLPQREVVKRNDKSFTSNLGEMGYV